MSNWTMDAAKTWIASALELKTGLNDNSARLGTMQTILFSVVYVENCCSLGAILAEGVDQLQERHDTHAVIGGARGRRDRVEMGGKQHAITFS